MSIISWGNNPEGMGEERRFNRRGFVRGGVMTPSVTFGNSSAQRHGCAHLWEGAFRKHCQRRVPKKPLGSTVNGGFPQKPPS